MQKFSENTEKKSQQDSESIKSPKQVFCFGDWEPKIDKYYSQKTECLFPLWEEDSRNPLRLKKEHLVTNRDGTLSSHYTWKNLRDEVRELCRDSILDHNDFYIQASSEVLELVSGNEIQKFATFCYTERWNKKKSKKSKT